MLYQHVAYSKHVPKYLDCQKKGGGLGGGGVGVGGGGVGQGSK